MIPFVLICIVSFLCIPSLAFAWGPLTHTYLGNELLSLGSLLPAGIYKIIKRHRKDFIYGNLMADIIVGKKYLPDHKNSHSWGFAFNLLSAAGTNQQKAFVYGYMCHLAADTVAHNIYTANKKSVRHTLLEMKADSIIDKKYWQQAAFIEPKIQMRNDVFLQNSIQRFIFSFKTNKRILKGVVYLTICYPPHIGDFIDRNLVTYIPDREKIEKLHHESLDRVVDLFQHWEKSAALKLNPSGHMHRKRLLNGQFKSFLFKPIHIRPAQFLGKTTKHLRDS
jgi:Zinc dependent phospholipase C